MAQIIAENYALQSLPEEEPSRLSFCDLPENNSFFTDDTPTAPSESVQPDPLFEFSVSLPNLAPQSSQNDVVFCGKTIHDLKSDRLNLNDYRKRDLFAVARSQSFRRQSFSDNSRRPDGFSGEIRSKGAAADLDYHGQRVNITSLTSMSAKSRRRMFMFGPVKFKPEMELREIKQRQAKLVPSEKFPPKSQWGVIKSSLRGRSPLTSLLARSLGCIPVAGRGVGSMVGGMTS